MLNSAPPSHPRPQGRGPTNHSWDTVRGVYIHNETGVEWAGKGKRSAESAAQQKQRTDKRQRDSAARNENASMKTARALRTAARRHPPPLVTRKDFEKLAAMQKAFPDGVGYDELHDQWARMLRRGPLANHHMHQHPDSIAHNLAHICSHCRVSAAAQVVRTLPGHGSTTPFRIRAAVRARTGRPPPRRNYLHMSAGRPAVCSVQCLLIMQARRG